MNDTFTPQELREFRLSVYRLPQGTERDNYERLLRLYDDSVGKGTLAQGARVTALQAEVADYRDQVTSLEERLRHAEEDSVRIQ